MTTPTGTVYLLHFERPIGDLANPRGQARHYLGYTEDLEGRLARHRAGNGSPLVAAVVAAGIGIELARTWAGGRHLERTLKGLKATPRLLCPICRGESGHAND